MTPIKNDSVLNNPISEEPQNGNLSTYQVKKVDETIKRRLSDECHYCLEPLDNGNPLYIYNCKHILHESCHLQLINNGSYEDCFLCHEGIELFSAYENANELAKHECVTYADEIHNQKLEVTKQQNQVANSELLQNKYTHATLLEKLEPAFAVLSQDPNHLQQFEQLFNLTYSAHKNSNYEISREIIEFLALNGIVFETPYNVEVFNNYYESEAHLDEAGNQNNMVVVDDHHEPEAHLDEAAGNQNNMVVVDDHYGSETYFDEAVRNQNIARQPANDSAEDSQTARANQNTENVSFLSRIKKKISIKGRK